MRVHCDEGIANHIGPEPCVVGREAGITVTRPALPIRFHRLRPSLRDCNSGQGGRVTRTSNILVDRSLFSAASVILNRSTRSPRRSVDPAPLGRGRRKRVLLPREKACPERGEGGQGEGTGRSPLASGGVGPSHGRRPISASCVLTPGPSPASTRCTHLRAPRATRAEVVFARASAGCAPPSPRSGEGGATT